MVHETRAGEIITLGAASWRVAEITRDRVIVNPAPGEMGKLPFWRGDGPGRPLELGRALGAFVRELEAECLAEGGDLHAGRGRAEAWLAAHWDLDGYAARNPVDYVVEQRPRALSKSQILEHVWPATFVSESNLASLVKEIRRALGDDADDPRFVRTVHGFGYAFAADAEVQEPPPAPASKGRTQLRILWNRREIVRAA